MPPASQARVDASPAHSSSLVEDVRTALVPGRGDLGILAVMLLPGAVAMVVVGAAAYFSEETLGTFTRDPLAVARMHPLTGVISNLGAILWSAGAALPLFTWFALRALGNAGRFQGVLLGGGLLTALLLFDDLFMLHESLYPRYLGLGTESEGPILGIYGLCMAAYLVRGRARLLEARPFLLAAALGLFALSVVGDQFVARDVVGRHMFEDGLKFLGIAAWLAFQGSVCLRALRDRS